MLLNNDIKLDIVMCALNDEDNTLLNITIATDDYNGIRNIFKNPDNLSVITVDDNLYNGYTDLIVFEGREVENSTVITIVLRYEGVKAEVDKIKNQLKESQEQVEMLQGCLMELGDLLYA